MAILCVYALPSGRLSARPGNDTAAMPAMDPEYACALAQDARGWWLLQLRPADAPVAPAQLTCFGGRRELGEDSEWCLRRELLEETDWTPRQLGAAVELWQGARFVARFYRVALDVPLARIHPEAGSVAILTPTPALPGLPVSPWHRQVLEAALRGETRVELAT